MSDRHYKAPATIDEAAARAGLTSADPAVRASTLLSAVLSGLPRALVEDALRRALADADLAVRRTAITAAGHAARLHRALDPAIVRTLEALKKEPALAAAASDALDDVETFLGRPTK